MRQCILLLISILLSTSPISAQFSISGGKGSPYDYKNEISTQLDHIYLLNTLDGVVLTYISQSNSVQFYKYSQSTANKTPIPNSDINITYSGGTTTYEITNIESDRGYVAEYGAYSNAIWITDYTKYAETFNSLSVDDEAENKCSSANFLFVKASHPIIFYDNDGAKEIKRKYTVKYKDQEWNSEKKIYIDKDKVETMHDSAPYRIPAPLIDTEIMISEDQFASHFGIHYSISTHYTAQKVETYLIEEVVKEGSTSAENPSGNDNVYIAPLEMNFYSNASDGANYYKWKIFHNTDPANSDDYLVSYNDEDISYTFTESGKYTITLEVKNLNSNCAPISDEISINIADSYLNFPNFLSPGTSTEGISNVFKASYKSIIRFKCTIFNRWGNKIYEWTDPEGGWDGTYKGKFVSPGVYFYVVDAEGSTGAKYKKGADINVLYGSNGPIQ